MKIKSVIEAIKGAKLERAQLMKWLLIALGGILLIVVLVWAGKARATPVAAVVPLTIVPVTVVPATVVPTAVIPTAAVPTAAASSTATPTAATQQAASSALGYAVFAGVGLAFWYVICAAEIDKNAEGFVARRLCFERTGWKFAPNTEEMCPTFANP